MSAADKDPEAAGNPVDPDATVVLQEDGGERPADIDSLAQALAEAQARAEECRNDYLRAVAELENVRKRAQRDIESAHRFGLERFALELLAVKDSLELGLEATEQASEQGPDRQLEIQSLLDGQKATLQLLEQVLGKFHINEINPIGEPFDPQLHEAMAMQPSDAAEPGSVLQVIQKGYRLHERLLRPARVIVAKAPDSA